MARWELSPTRMIAVTSGQLIDICPTIAQEWRIPGFIQGIIDKN